MKDDTRMIEHISNLVEEERRLREYVAREGDQCWDLLRRRRGRRDAGADPESAEPRDPDTVESYLQ